MGKDVIFKSLEHHVTTSFTSTFIHRGALIDILDGTEKRNGMSAFFCGKHITTEQQAKKDLLSTEEYGFQTQRHPMHPGPGLVRPRNMESAAA